MLLQIKKLTCHYQHKTVINDLSLQLKEGGLSCLIGPSGCGKTTLLRAIAGFIKPSGGSIVLRGYEVSNSQFNAPAETRRVGMVFQDYALFPHLNVEDNIAFGLNSSKSAKRNRVNELLDLIGLSEFNKRYPHELSGGQQQRISLARALAPKPSLVLLDEPFSSLDIELKERLCPEVRDILKQQNAAALLVTHDQQEAFAFGQWVGVLNEGKLLQWANPYELYHEPACRFVADFIGQGRMLNGTLLTPELVQSPVGLISGNRVFLWPKGTKLDILLRPDDVLLSDETDPSRLLTIVIAKSFKGSQTLYTLRLNDGTEILSFFSGHCEYEIGATVFVKINTEHLVVFPSETQH